jgi:hypothetical protein
VVPHGPISIQPRRNTEVNGHAETRRKSREVVGKSGPPRHHAFHSLFSAPPPLCGSPVSVFLGLDSPPRLGVTACRSPPDHPTASHHPRRLDGDEQDLVPTLCDVSASRSAHPLTSPHLGVGREVCFRAKEVQRNRVDSANPNVMVPPRDLRCYRQPKSLP